jgi:hypothetical protein
MRRKISEGAAWLSRVRRGSEGAAWLSRVRRGSEGCGVARKGAAWLGRVRRGSVASAPGCCKAAPGSNPSRAPHGGPSRLSSGDEDIFAAGFTESRRMNEGMNVNKIKE